MAKHKQTDRCGFDRNGSDSMNTYVCTCGWFADLAKVNHRSRFQRVLCWIFALVYRRWLLEEKATVLKVKGWRTALIGHGYKLGQRKTVTPCFWWLK